MKVRNRHRDEQRRILAEGFAAAPRGATWLAAYDSLAAVVDSMKASQVEKMLARILRAPPPEDPDLDPLALERDSIGLLSMLFSIVLAKVRDVEDFRVEKGRPIGEEEDMERCEVFVHHLLELLGRLAVVERGGRKEIGGGTRAVPSSVGLSGRLAGRRDVTVI